MNKLEIYKLEDLNHLKYPVVLDDVRESYGKEPISVPYFNEYSSHIIEAKLRGSEGRYLHLDLNPISRGYKRFGSTYLDNYFLQYGTSSYNIQDGKQFQEKFFEDKYFANDDLVYDRLTGLGWRYEYADALDDGFSYWKKTIQRNGSNQNVFPNIPTEIRDKYESNISIDYVYGLFHPDGNSGGQFTSFEDYTVLLTQADQITRQKIFNFLNDVYHVSDESEISSHLSLRYYIILSACGYELDPDEINRLRNSLEEINQQNSELSQDYIASFSALSYLINHGYVSFAAEETTFSETVVIGKLLTNDLIQNLKTEAKKLLPLYFESLIKQGGAGDIQIKNRLNEIATLLPEEERIPLPYADFDDFLTKNAESYERDESKPDFFATLTDEFFARAENAPFFNSENYEGQFMPFVFSLPENKSEMGLYAQLIMDSTNLNMLALLYNNHWINFEENKEFISLIPDSFFLKDEKDEKKRVVEMTIWYADTIAEKYPEIIFEFSIWQELIKYSPENVGIIFDRYYRMLNISSLYTEKTASELWDENIAIHSSEKSKILIKRMREEFKDSSWFNKYKDPEERLQRVDAYILRGMTSIHNLLSGIGGAYNSFHHDPVMYTIFHAYNTGNVTQLKESIAQANDELFLPRGYALVCEIDDRPKAPSICVPVSVDYRVTRVISGKTVSAYVVSNPKAGSFFGKDYHRMLEHLGIDERVGVTTSHVNYALYQERYHKNEKTFSGPVIIKNQLLFEAQYLQSVKNNLENQRNRHAMAKFLDHTLDSINNPEEYAESVLLIETAEHEFAHIIYHEEVSHGKREERYSYLRGLAVSPDPFATLALYANHVFYYDDEDGNMKLSKQQSTHGTYEKVRGTNGMGQVYFYLCYARDIGLLEPDQYFTDLTEEGCDRVIRELADAIYLLPKEKVNSLAARYAKQFLSDSKR